MKLPVVRQWLIAAMIMPAIASMLVAFATTAHASGKTCPDGSTYNKSTKQCERTAIAECPPSFDYFAESVVCAGPVVLSCPDGLTYDSVYVACTATPTCPPPAFGAYPDGTSLMCVADLADPCPAGFEYDESSPYLGAPACVAPRGCPEGSALGFSDSLCVAQPTAECPAGATYDQSSVGIDPGHACKIAPTFTCPPEFTIDSERSVCQAAPIKGRKR